MEKNLHKMKPRYCEDILPVPWPFVISRFHYKFCHKIQIQTTIPIVSGWPVQNNYQWKKPIYRGTALFHLDHSSFVKGYLIKYVIIHSHTGAYYDFEYPAT